MRLLPTPKLSDRSHPTLTMGWGNFRWHRGRANTQPGSAGEMQLVA